MTPEINKIQLRGNKADLFRIKHNSQRKFSCIRYEKCRNITEGSSMFHKFCCAGNDYYRMAGNFGSICDSQFVLFDMIAIYVCLYRMIVEKSGKYIVCWSNGQNKDTTSKKTFERRNSLVLWFSPYRRHLQFVCFFHDFFLRKILFVI